jgi:hypothetical protein
MPLIRRPDLQTFPFYKCVLEMGLRCRVTFKRVKRKRLFGKFAFSREVIHQIKKFAGASCGGVGCVDFDPVWLE